METFVNKIQFECAANMLERLRHNEGKLEKARDALSTVEGSSKHREKETHQLTKKIQKYQQAVERDASLLSQFKEQLNVFAAQCLAILEFEQSLITHPTIRGEIDSSSLLRKNQLTMKGIIEWKNKFDSKTNGTAFMNRSVSDKYRIDVEHTKKMVHKHAQNRRSQQPQKQRVKRPRKENSADPDYEGLY